MLVINNPNLDDICLNIFQLCDSLKKSMLRMGQDTMELPPVGNKAYVLVCARAKLLVLFNYSINEVDVVTDFFREYSIHSLLLPSLNREF